MDPLGLDVTAREIDILGDHMRHYETARDTMRQHKILRQ